MSDLATAMRVPVSTASRIVDRLVRKGLLERGGGQDRRTIHVRFSRCGLKIGRVLFDWRRTTAQSMLRELTAPQRRALFTALGRLMRPQEE